MSTTRSTHLPTSQRDAALDGLRGIAIAMVLWHHLVSAYLPAGRDGWLGLVRVGTNLTWSGVDLFFVLSGYFIGGILLDRRDSPQLARVFYFRRAVRILPLYYVTLAVTFLAIAGHEPGSYHRFAPWIYATFVTNFAVAYAQNWDWLPLSVLWSLAVEEQFYFAAPWIVRAIPRARQFLAIVGIIFAAWLARTATVIFFPTGHLGVHVLMPMRMDALALGALVAWAIRDQAAAALIGRLGQRWRTGLAISLFALGAVTVVRPLEGSAFLCLVGYTLIAAAFGVIVALVAVVRPPTLLSLLSTRPLVHLGRHSYFVYLWHALIGRGIILAFGGPQFSLRSPGAFGIVAMAIGATWATAIVSWKLLEGPLVAWGQRQTY